VLAAVDDKNKVVQSKNVHDIIHQCRWGLVFDESVEEPGVVNWSVLLKG